MKFLLLFATISLLFAEEEYAFAGKHFLASYLDCDPSAIENIPALSHAMEQAVLASNATLLDQVSYTFSPNGWTAVYLLSESHASIHTYPEHRACFVDLFTCGDHCQSEAFDAALRAYLRPQTTKVQKISRGHEIEIHDSTETSPLPPTIQP